MLPVAVDAMGGDKAPGEIVAGALRGRGAGDRGRTGRPEDLDTKGLPRIAASEVIEMGEDPAGGVRRKKDATLVRAAEAVRDGTAPAMVSAGNTGATMASALLRMGRIKGVSRPAIATVLPVPGSTRATVLLDAGANAECQPEWLVQFAQMGSVFARHRFGLDAPRVGLLSIGEENTKGNTLVKETHAAGGRGRRDVHRQRRGPGHPHRRRGHRGHGWFSGNVVLKSLEGALPAIMGAVERALTATDELSAQFEPLRPTSTRLREPGARQLRWRHAPRRPRGVHHQPRSSSAKAMFNAINMAREMVVEDVVAELRAAVTDD